MDSNKRGNKEWFLKEANWQRELLKGKYSSSDLCVNLEEGVAVVGIQTSYSGVGYDTVYVFRVTDWKKKEVVKYEPVLDKRYENGGRLWPTGISEDGKILRYSEKLSSGTIFDRTIEIEKDKLVVYKPDYY